MMARAALALALAGAALPAHAAEGGPIRGGEHADFSRIVMTIEPTTEWSLETGDGEVTIRFPGKSLSFGTGEVFARMPRTRIGSVTTAAEGGGTSVRVGLECDCRVSTVFVGGRYLALDVGDPGPLPPPETPQERSAREAEAVATAEALLIRQIERAAGQGIVEMTEEAPAGPDEPGVGLDAVAAMLRDREQIAATTVYDRDGRPVGMGDDAATPSACLPDESLDVASWSNGLSFPAQLASLRRGLVGEFDEPRPEGVRDLARLYLRFGFGAEAHSLVTAFGGEVPDGPLLADLGRVVDGEQAAADGPLAVTDACPGLHGLWLALGQRAALPKDGEPFAPVAAAFGSLPVDLRRLIGPGFVERLVDADRPEAARTIYDTMIRSGDDASAAVDLSGGRLLAAEGQTDAALSALSALADSGDPVATDATIALARVAVRSGQPVPDRTVLDLRAAALQARGTPREAAIRALLAEALAGRAELPASIRESRAAIVDLPDAASRFETIAVASLGAAEPQRVGAAAYAETVLAAADLLAGAPARDPARRRVASHLVALGLPEPALATLAPALVLGDPAARLIGAEAELALGAPAAARMILDGIEGERAVALRARSLAAEGRYADARAALAAAGLDAAAYAWPSGDWAAVADEETGTPRATMAAYMDGRHEGAAPAERPDSPEAAFRAPLPALDRPSLGAARTLLQSGDGVGRFVADVIKTEADGTALP